MPHTNKASAPVSVDIPEFEGRYVDLDGHTPVMAVRPDAQSGVLPLVVTGAILPGRQ